MRRILLVLIIISLISCGKSDTDKSAPYIVAVSKKHRIKKYWKKHKKALAPVLKRLEQSRIRLEKIKKRDSKLTTEINKRIRTALRTLNMKQIEFVYLIFEDPMGRVSRMIHDRIVEYWQKNVRLSVAGQIRPTAQVWLFRTRKGAKGSGVYADDSLHLRAFAKKKHLLTLKKTEQLEFLFPRSGSVELYSCEDRLSWKTVHRIGLQPAVQGKLWQSRKVIASKLKGSTFFIWYWSTGDFYWKKVLWVKQQSGSQ